MFYILSLVLLLAFYICLLFLMKYMQNTKLWNGIFTAAIVLCYLFVVVKTYISVGFHDWNFQNTLPVANVSPFTFTIVGFIHLFPRKLKSHFYFLFSLLSVGMLLSAILSCVYNASIHYSFHFSFLADYFAHIMLSLWGVYLIKSRQITPSKQNAVISSSFILGVAFSMLILNIIFDTAFFGLSLNGKHNIYNTVLTKSSYLSAILYFFGLVSVLFLGYFYSILISKRLTKTNPTEQAKNE